jgi:hypothetical protein
MGILDHRKTWRYTTAASPDQCVGGFAKAFSGGGGLLLRAKWSVKRSATGAVAIYEGRKGIVALVTAFSQTSQAEEQGAKGSKVTFEIEQADSGKTVCAMWLSENSTKLGFTGDGRFFRPYMRAVETCLRELDPAVQVTKD